MNIPKLTNQGALVGNMAFKNIKRNSGFTIVELLIVIVVIAILATISIVAYNGVQARGRSSAAQSAAISLDKKAEIYFAVNSQYPTTAGVITGTNTQGTVTTSTTSDWYVAPGSAFTTTTVAAGATGLSTGTAAPSDPKILYYTNASATAGGCVWWYDFQNTTWKSTQVGTVTCPALPAPASGLASTAI